MKLSKIILPEDKLIAAIRVKSREGSTMLYDRYSKTLYTVIFRIVNDKEMAEDIFQEAFMKIWNSFDKYDASKGRLFTWMCCVARNVAKDALRTKLHHKYMATVPLENHIEKVEQQGSMVLNTDTLGMQLWTKNLKKSQKDIVDLIYFKGYTHAEVAHELAIPLGTVKTRCRTGINVLRAIYNDLPIAKINTLPLNLKTAN